MKSKNERRMQGARSAAPNKGGKPLSHHRGKAPAPSGARMVQSGTQPRKSFTPVRAVSTIDPSDAETRKIRKNGFVALPPQEDKETPPMDAPSNPYHPVTFSNAEREQLFGKFDYTPKPVQGNAENIVVDPKWVEENIVRLLELPYLKDQPHADKRGFTLKGYPFHKLVAPHFLALLDAWQEAGLIDRILLWNGSYVPRFRRGQTQKGVLSAHSWGSAFDINARWNPLGQTPAPKGAEGSVLELVDIAEERGWVWGGRFTRPDGMHFEAGPGLFR